MSRFYTISEEIASGRPFSVGVLFLPVQNSAILYDRKRSKHEFARVEGESFILYRDVASAKRLDVRALSVAQRRGQPLHDHLNNRWVTATGIVDAKAHGLWGFPCELLLEEAHAVRHQ